MIFFEQFLVDTKTISATEIESAIADYIKLIDEIGVEDQLQNNEDILTLLTIIYGDYVDFKPVFLEAYSDEDLEEWILKILKQLISNSKTCNSDFEEMYLNLRTEFE